MKKKTKHIPLAVKIVAGILSVTSTIGIVTFQFIRFLFRNIWTFLKRPWYNTIEIIWSTLFIIEAILEWLGEHIRAVLRWLQYSLKHYLKRILWALADKELLPRYAYWGTKDYITDILIKVLPWYIENKNSFPNHYKNVEAYTKDLKEFLVLCQQAQDDDMDLIVHPKTINKAYHKEIMRRYKRREYFYSKVLPYLWD